MNNFCYMQDREFSKGRRYIGASNMPTLIYPAAGEKVQTPYEFWEVWTGRKDPLKGNKRMMGGHRQEPIILAEWVFNSILKDFRIQNEGNEPTEKQIKYAAKEARAFLISRLKEKNRYKKYHSWTEAHATDNERFVAHADLLDLSHEIPSIVQAKNVGRFAADARKKNPYMGYSKDDLSQNGIQFGVYLQEQWELYCYGLPRADVAVQIEGWDIRTYGPVEYRKKDVERLVVRANLMLWHIDNDIPPTPKTWKDIYTEFPDLEKNTKSVVSGQDEIDARIMIAQKAKIKEKMRILQSRNLDIEMALALMACEPSGVMHNYLTTADGTKLASFSERAGSRRLDLRRMEKEFPELARQADEAGLISQDSPSRMIYISGAPAGSVNLWTLITYEEDKPKKSRKKYTSKEKKEADKLLESCGVKHGWERYLR